MNLPPMSKILVFQHAEHEGLGTIADELKLAGHTTETLLISNTTLFPSGTKLEEYGSLIILGGSMGVYEETQYSWMSKELMVLREALRQKKPILGVCLGAQLIAKAAGARVYPGSSPEVGWYSIRLDDWFYKRNPLFFQIDPTKDHMVFQWHHDTFDLPTEGYRLAWNDDYSHQAFCYQGNAVGLQFHVEMTEDMVRLWLEDTVTRNRLKHQGFDPDQILADMPKYLPGLRTLCHKICYGFTSLIRDNVRRVA